jgi:hypothetical protein
MGYTKTNLREVENQAPKFGMPEELEARFARTALGGETLGLSLMKLAPSFRIPFGHKHAGQMRAVEAGPDGVQYLAFGAGDDPADAEMVQDWWSN